MILARIYGYGCLVLLCASLTLFGLWQHADAELARYQAKQGQDQMDAVDKANKRAADLQRRLDSLPRPSNKIREVVRENPSDCVLRPAVVDSLRKAIREGNSARKVP